MFKSKQAKIVAFLTLACSLLGVLVIFPVFREDFSLENSRLITIPLDNQSLALSFDGHCLARIEAKTKSEKLLTLDLQLLDLKTNQNLFSSKSYYNPIGQLVASNSLVEQKEFITNGIGEISVTVISVTAADKKFLLNGPISAFEEQGSIRFQYPYGFRKWSKVLSIFRRINFIDISKCNSLGDFQRLVNELRNA